jgi:predicted nucleic acid-binding protein
LAALEIDISKLPQRALFDTGVVIRALGERPGDPESHLCERLWEAMLVNGRDILIAAPSIAEMYRHSGKVSLPHRKNIEVVAFDAQAAVLLGTKFPKAVLDAEVKTTGLVKNYIKYDALIAATASRYRATHIVTLDGDLTSFASQLSIVVVKPMYFARQQTGLKL